MNFFLLLWVLYALVPLITENILILKNSTGMKNNVSFLISTNAFQSALVRFFLTNSLSPEKVLQDTKIGWRFIIYMVFTEIGKSSNCHRLVNLYDWYQLARCFKAGKSNIFTTVVRIYAHNIHAMCAFNIITGIDTNSNNTLKLTYAPGPTLLLQPHLSASSNWLDLTPILNTIICCVSKVFYTCIYIYYICI